MNDAWTWTKERGLTLGKRGGLGGGGQRGKIGTTVIEQIINELAGKNKVREKY